MSPIRNRAHGQRVLALVTKAKTLSEDIDAKAFRDCCRWLELATRSDTKVQAWIPANVRLALIDPSFKADPKAIEWLRAKARRPSIKSGWHAQWALEKLGDRAR